LVDPGIGLKNLGKCLAEAAPEAFIGITQAQWARRILGWGRKTIRRTVTVDPIYFPFDEGRSLSLLRAYARHPDQGPFSIANTAPDETAAILFTSGSTGVPKGVVYTHAIFDTQVAMLRDIYGIEPGEVDLSTFPLFALFGPALGMTCIIPEMDATRPAKVDPLKIFAAIEDFGVTNLFGSPALIWRIGEWGTKLPTLRRVISAGAPVPAKVLETFAMMLDAGIQIFTPYGATEALPVCSIGSDEILGETRHQTDQGAGVCVGRPVEGMTVRIIAISDDPIPVWSDDLVVPDGTIGEIAVQGPIVTRRYYQRPESTALAKIAEPGGEGFYHRMGDVGYRDAQGRIWFCGRKSHRVITTDGTLFTIPCEGVFNTHPAVARTALVGVGAPGAQRPVLCVELCRPPLGSDRRRVIEIHRELLEIGAGHPHTREITTILFHPSFPVDIRHNAKIFREKLAIWAARKLQ
jgi:acyl-CoA synthetase (AMP-forming)/AMP-acid ligase II